MLANETKIASMIRLNAGNDRNGNPRRVYVGLDDNGTIAGTWDEGYDGALAVPADLRRLARLATTFMTTPAEYRALLRWGT